MKKLYVILFVLFILLMIVDYINLPFNLDILVSRINWNIWLDLFNILIVIGLFIFTYKKIDKKIIKAEHNKKEVSIMLLKDCYRECISYIDLLTEETVNNYIVPKTDFNGPITENDIISKLQQAPFINENIIIDFVKNGQINIELIECYFEIKKKYKQYINMRVTFFDVSYMYDSLNLQLQKAINKEIHNLTKQ